MGKSYIPSGYTAASASKKNQEYHYPLWFEEAKRIVRENNLYIPAEAIIAQWICETGHFSAPNFSKQANLAGMSWTVKGAKEGDKAGKYTLMKVGYARPEEEGGHYLKVIGGHQKAADAYAEFINVSSYYGEFKKPPMKTIKQTFELWSKHGWGTGMTGLWNGLESFYIGNRIDLPAATKTAGLAYARAKGGKASPPLYKEAGSNAKSYEVTGDGGGGVSAVPTLLQLARSYIGHTKYQYSGDNFVKKATSGKYVGYYHGDCSAFTRYVFKVAASINLERVTIDQAKQGTKIESRDSLQAGDLIFFKGTNPERGPNAISHVGIVSDKKNMMVHCSSSNGAAEDDYTNSYWGPKFAGGVRFSELGSAGGSGSSYFGGDINLYGAAGETAAGEMLLAGLPSRISGRAPSPEDDYHPKHRYSSSPFVLRIGDSQFYLPPTAIRHSKVSSASQQPIMRSRTGMVEKAGWADTNLEIDIIFPTVDDINGYEAIGPDGYTYYYDGFRNLLAQFHKNPMLPIRNEFLNFSLGIYNVVINNMVVTTVEGFPDMLQVTLQMSECVTQPYTGLPEFLYDACFNYPVWRWFYHNLLFDPDTYQSTQRIESVALRTIKGNMNSSFRIRALHDAEIDKMKEDLTKKYMEENPNDDITNLNPAYLIGRFKGVEVRHLMQEWNLFDPIITNITGSIDKDLSRKNMMTYEAPIYQDMGGINKMFQISMMLTTREQVNALQELSRHVERVAREYRHNFVGGFVEVSNDILNLCGVEFALINSVQIQTTDISEVFQATIVLSEFNPNQAGQETLNGLTSDLTDIMKDMIDKNPELAVDVYTATTADQYNTVRQEYIAEEMMRTMELYPDLRLPTLRQANKALAGINEWRASKGYEKIPFDTFPAAAKDHWVESDFYFIYPSVDDAWDAIGLGQMGAKLSHYMTTGELALPGENSEGTYRSDLDDIVSAIGGGDSVVATMLGGYNPNAYSVSDEGEIVQNVQAHASATNIVPPTHDLYTNFFNEWGETLEPIDDDTMITYMMYDMYRYNQRLRLTQFFPSYIMLFVDEGQWMSGRRLINQYYSYHSINELTVTKDKNTGVDLAYISLSNVYGTFNKETKFSNPGTYDYARGKGLFSRAKQLYDAFHFDASTIIQEATEQLDVAHIRQGARVHIRMGNSSNADTLPICFNGHVSAVTEGYTVEIMAQGDGAELMSNVLSGSTGQGSPNEPHNAILKYMTKRETNFLYQVLPTIVGENSVFQNHDSYYGIEHFGWIERTDDPNRGSGIKWWNAVTGHSDDDLAEASTTKPDSVMLGMIASTARYVGTVWKETWAMLSAIDNATTKWIVGAVTGNMTFVTYDVMKNVYRGNPNELSTGVFKGKNESLSKDPGSYDNVAGSLDLMFESVKDGEKNANFSEYGKTTWDMGQQLSMFVPEFIFGIHPHGIRSTVFFGQPHWMVKFRYIKDGIGEEEDLTKWKEQIKPYQQLHMINSGVNLLANQMTVTDETLTHIMTSTFSMGSLNNTTDGIRVYADKSILREYQKHEAVDTGILQDYFGPDAIMTGVLDGFVRPSVGVVADTVSSGLGLIDWAVGWTGLKWFGKKSDQLSQWNTKAQADMSAVFRAGETQAESVIIGAMQRNFMEMYQGEITILGNAAMKPWDLFYMDDSDMSVSGTAQVGSITHTLSRQTGFVTVIKPDLIVSRVSEGGTRNRALNSIMRVGTTIGTVVLHRVANWKVTQSMGHFAVHKARYVMIKGINGMDWTASRILGLDLWGDKAKVNDLDDTMRKWGNNAMKASRKFFVLGLVTSFLGEKLLRWYDQQTLYNNVIYIHPLYKAGEPMTAGVKGGLHIIPGYSDPRFLDPGGSGTMNVTSNGDVTTGTSTADNMNYALTSPKQQLVTGSAKIGYDGLIPKYITVHETANTGAGAGAQSHANLQTKGNDREASWHFSVDDKEIIQSYPLTWVAFHAGSTTGNTSSIGIELCVNSDGNFTKTKTNGAKLVADLCVGLGISITNVVPHRHWSGKDCPHNLLSNNGKQWNEFVNEVKGFIVEAQKKSVETKVTGSVGNSTVNAITGQVSPLEVTKVKAMAMSGVKSPFLTGGSSKIIKNFNVTGKMFGVDISYKSKPASGIYSVHAIKGGVVKTISTTKTSDLTVVIEHTHGTNKFYSVYGNLKAGSVEVKQGADVKQGAMIGVQDGSPPRIMKTYIEIHVGQYSLDSTISGNRVNPEDFFKWAGDPL